MDSNLKHKLAQMEEKKQSLWLCFLTLAMGVHEIEIATVQI